MVVVAQLVRALDCGSRGRRFETGLPPFKNPSRNRGFFFNLVCYLDFMKADFSTFSTSISTSFRRFIIL